MLVIKLVNVSKYYNSNDVIALGLRKVSLELGLNEFVAIVGESGSGKTTLLNVISGMDTYEDGEMYINGEETSYFSLNDMENYRKKYIAFVFQDYNLIDSYTVLQNVEAPLILSGYPKNKVKKRALEIIKKVGLEKHIKHKATKLSGGQKQRVVIARALAKDCPIIAADEPTGNLDSASAKQIIELLAEIAKERLVVMVTHDFSQVENYATRKIRIYDGEVVEDKELVKTNKLSLPKLDDKEYKMPFSSSLKLSLRNLFSVPKKTFLMFLVFTFFSIFIGLVYGGYVLSSIETSYSYNQHFNYTNPDRLVVKKANNQPFLDTDLEQLLGVSKVKDVIDSDYVLDVSRTMRTLGIDSDYFSVSFLPISLLGDRAMLYGIMPSLDYEVVLAAEAYILEDEDKLIGQNITEAYGWYDSNMTLKISGIISNEIIPGNENYYRNFAFVGDKLWDELAKNTYLRNYAEVFLLIAGERVQLLNNNLTIDESLEANQIRANIMYYNYSDCQTDTCVSNTKLSISDYYVKQTIDVEFTLTSSLGQDQNIHISQELYDEIFYDEIYQVSVITTDDINVDGVVRNISRIREGLSFKYKVVYPYDSAYSNEFEGILLLIANIGMIFLIFITLTGSTLITYVIFKMIINTKMHDYTIFRTIGANQKVIKRFIYFENLYIVMMSFIVFVIASIAIPNNLPEYSVFRAFKVFDFGKYLVYLSLLIMMSLFISRRYCNRIFSGSVSKTLKTDLR